MVSQQVAISYVHTPHTIHRRFDLWFHQTQRPISYRHLFKPIIAFVVTLLTNEEAQFGLVAGESGSTPLWLIVTKITY